MSDSQTTTAPAHIAQRLTSLPPELEGARCARLARWRHQKPEFQPGGSAATQQVLSHFLTERAEGYQRFISKPEEAARTAHACHPTSPGKPQFATGLPDPQTSPKSGRMGPRTIRLRIATALALPFHSKV